MAKHAVYLKITIFQSVTSWGLTGVYMSFRATRWLRNSAQRVSDTKYCSVWFCGCYNKFSCGANHIVVTQGKVITYELISLFVSPRFVYHTCIYRRGSCVGLCVWYSLALWVWLWFLRNLFAIIRTVFCSRLCQLLNGFLSKWQR